jgi:LemA protein
MNYIGLILFVIVILLLLWVITTYNSLITLKNKVKNQWSQIDVLLKRRSDLIPNLVETVKGYTKHEEETLTKVIEARNKYVDARNDSAKMASSQELGQALGKLFALAESYPELKANTNFEQLQKELSETEDKITYARQFYNDAVMTYQTKISTFPNNIIASLFHFQKEHYFETSEKEKEVPQVKF